jgi:DNA-binding NarL/FixJ family response regulator
MQARGMGLCLDARPAGRYWGEGAVRQKRLTSREYEVLSLIATDMSNKEIASRLSITEGTVKIHVHHILSKLGVNSRIKAISKGLKNHPGKCPLHFRAPQRAASKY